MPSQSVAPLLLLPLALPPAFAFSPFRLPIQAPAFLSPPANPSLDAHASAQAGLSLKIRLDVGRDDDGGGGRLPVDGLHLELDGAALPKGQKRPTVPGSDGPHPSLSSGPRSLRMVHDGMFIDMGGLRQVGLEDGCWEMVWRQDAPAGAVICAFDHPEEVRRNEHSASLPRGRIYLSFPVFTRDGLTERQERKVVVNEVARKHIEERDLQFRKMQDTGNPLMKALHFRNACAAQEQYDFSGARILAMIPEDTEVAPIGGDLVMCLKGTIWTKNDSFFGKDHALLGVAMAKPEFAKPKELKP